MKTYEGKTEEEALNLASQDLGQKAEDIKYHIVSDVKKLFSRKVTIGVYTMADVIEYASNYLETLCEMIEIKIRSDASLQDDVIKINIETEAAPRIIGHNGETLRALNELTRSAVFNRFGGHYRILLNCDNYKDQKYEKLIRMARRIAGEVRRSGITASLDSMTSDERRVIHNALSSDTSIKTISEGVGRQRHLTIRKATVTEMEEIVPTVEEEIISPAEDQEQQ